MAKTKTDRQGANLVLSKEKTDNPKLCAKRLKDGRLSLYLLYYLGYQKTVSETTAKETIRATRQKRSLNLYLYENPRTPSERQECKDAMELAKRIRFEKEQELKLQSTGYRIQKNTDTDFLEYYRNFLANYTKLNYRSVKTSYNRFANFLKETPKYRLFANRIKPAQINKDLVLDFVEYLKKHSKGGGAACMFTHFKRVVRTAAEHDLFVKNPCDGITVKTDSTALKKAFLSIEEIQALVDTPFQGNHNIKRAFLFSLYTGLRWCDIKELRYENVDYSNRVLSFTQKKTEGRSAHAGVTTPLTESTLALIGERGEAGARIFDLPSHNYANRLLHKWVYAAGITKHISWHCARHSFAVNLISHNIDIATVQSLMGHASISMTERYLHVVDGLKKSAVEVFPVLEL